MSDAIDRAEVRQIRAVAMEMLHGPGAEAAAKLFVHFAGGRIEVPIEKFREFLKDKLFSRLDVDIRSSVNAAGQGTVVIGTRERKPCKCCGHVPNAGEFLAYGDDE